MEQLQGKCVLLGITGGIAAYKMANVASALVKAGAEVHVVMTENATQFITPLTFETLTNNRCVVDTFARDFQYDVTHISLAKKADLILVAPATANVIAKLAHGIADDMLTTVVLAARCVSVGDKIIIMSYAQMTPEEVKNDYHPNVVFVDENNKIARVTTYEKHGLLKDMT